MISFCPWCVNVIDAVNGVPSCANKWLMNDIARCVFPNLRYLYPSHTHLYMLIANVWNHQG
jgi:hypothetical protein